MSIGLETEAPESDFSDDDLVSLGSAVVDDLCLLGSFSCRRRIMWFRRLFFSGESIVHDLRCIGPSLRESVIFVDDMTIDPGKKKDFLEATFSAYRERRQDGIDLRIPIDFLLGGHEQETIEAKFALYFLALEKLKDIYSRARGIASNLPRKRFDLLYADLEALLETKYLSVNRYCANVALMVRSQHERTPILDRVR